MKRKRFVWWVLALFSTVFVVADDSLRERLQDQHVEQTDSWVYNNIQQAINDSKTQNKPIFVTFRCVPCKACSAFDADVANGNERVRQLVKDKFIAVRQVEMKGVDLSRFQFEYDLNWAGIFINADGAVYARYGTQSSEGPDAYNSIDGLMNTMNRVIELHAGYPDNRAELLGKQGDEKPIRNAVELPGLYNRDKYAQQTTRQNCIHCHNIHDAEHQHALETGRYSPELLLKYPLPDNIGMKIDRQSGVRIREIVSESAADQAGLQPNEEIVRMNGQRVTSIADMQWVLHHLPNLDTQVEVDTHVSGRHTVMLKAGWKRYDFSWRASMWNAPPRFQAWAPVLAPEERMKLGLPDSHTALEIRWINRESAGGLRAIEDGLREKDVIIAIAGKPLQMNTRQFNVHIKSNYKVGDVLPIKVLRNGKTEELQLHLVE